MTQIFNCIRSYFKGDRWLLSAVIFLVILSVLAVYSSTSALAYQKMHGDTAYYLGRHCVMLLAGVFTLGTFSHIRPKYFSGTAELMLVASILLLVAALVSGSSINGSSRWVRVGSLTFQPSEIAKISLMIYAAKQLAKHDGEPNKAFWPIVVATGIVCGLILLENLSTFILVATSVGVLMIVGRVSLMKLGLLGASLGVFIGLIIYFAPLVSEVFPPAKRALTWRARIERFSGDDASHSNRRKDKTQEEQAPTQLY